MGKRPDHHEIPKHYLRGFCEPNTSFVWVFERSRPFGPGIKSGANNPVKRGLRLVALRPDGYAARTINGKTHYKYEDALQKLELRATPAINKTRAFEEIDAAEKESLAGYVLLTLKRLTIRDATILSQVKMAKLKIVEVAEREMRKAALEGEFAKAIEMQRQAAYWESEGDRQFLRDSMIGDIGMVKRYLTARPWEFVIAPPGYYFVTCDNPIGNAGLARSLIFPLSQDVVLRYAFDGQDLAYRQATSEEMFSINGYIISHAEKEIYSPRPDEWIHKQWVEGELRDGH